MKIKLSYVTNSSSCSYIVCIPRGLDSKKLVDEVWGQIEPNIIKEYSEEREDVSDEQMSEEEIKNLKNITSRNIDDLKIGDSKLLEEDCIGYSILRAAVLLGNLVVARDDVGSYEGKIMNIDVNETLNILRKHSDWVEKVLKGVPDEDKT